MNCKICLLPFDKHLRVKLDCCEDSFICYDCCKIYLEETKSLLYCPVTSDEKHLLWFSEGDKELRRILKLKRVLKYKIGRASCRERVMIRVVAVRSEIIKD